MFSITDYKLCLIRHETAYFTTQALDKQWGDDWNDVPYECNAGSPYLWLPVNDADKPPWDILRIRIELPDDVRVPAYLGARSNSPYSVRDINRGAVPWLTGRFVAIWAGTTYPEFVKLAHKMGIDIWQRVEG